jgi:Spy/CpxP family protein refolding chaperone
MAAIRLRRTVAAIVNHFEGPAMKQLNYRAIGRPLRVAAAVLTLALAGGVALNAAAHPPHGMGGPMMMGGSGHMRHMLDAVNATDEQRSQIKAIMDAARSDLQAQHGASRTLQQQAMQLFTQPIVDANAAEALRQQMLVQHDQASKRMMLAMLDVSRVLTPEQRQKLGERMAQRHAMMERRHAERQAQDKSTPR